MKTISPFFILSCVWCLLCHFTPIQAQSPVKADKYRHHADSTQITSSIKKFLLWYKSNYAKANGFGLVKNDKAGNYTVDQDACKKYLQYLKGSGYISDTYVAEWSSYFRSREEYFKINVQNEGPPEGFSYDLVLLTQEPELILDAIHTLAYKIKETRDNFVVMEVQGAWLYDFEMSRKNGVWRIDYISSTNFD